MTIVNETAWVDYVGFNDLSGLHQMVINGIFVCLALTQCVTCCL